MLIRSVDPSQLVDAYDVKEQLFYPWPEVAATPFGSGWLVVEPGRRTKPHNHHEHETFFILRGQGMMTAAGESREVGPGDVVYLPPFGDHILENTSPRDDLHFLSIWWEEPAVLAGLKEPAAADGRPQPPPPTLAVAVCAGGDRGPAADDLAGPCLGVEILARFARLQGARVRSVLDLATAPAAAAPAAQNAANANAGAADVDVDDVDAADGAAADALALCERLRVAGEAALRSRPALYCEACRRHPAAGEVSGECAGCGRRIGGAGSGCPGCGQPTCGGEALAGAVCDRCGGALVRREVTRLCFALAGHEEAVRRHYERTAMSPRLRALVDLALDRGLPELAISLPAEPGAASPPPGLLGQRFERWFARAARLLATAGDAAPEAADATEAAGAAPEAADGPVVFLGLGEAFLYAVVLPALADAARATAYAPAALVEAEDYRAALAGFAAPGGAGEPPAEWQPWLRGLAQRLAQDHQGLAPPTQAWTREQQRFAGRLLRLAEEAAAAYQPATFSPVEAARRLGDLVRAASEFAAAEQPWRRVASRTEERNTGVALELLAAKLLAQLAHPLLPKWSAALWRCLGYSSRLGEDGEHGNGDGAGSWEAVPSFVPTGSPIRGLEELAQGSHAAATPAPPRRRRRAPAGRARGAGRG